MTGHPDTRLAAIARRPPDEANDPFTVLVWVVSGEVGRCAHG
jgi:hypothetical protein